MPDPTTPAKGLTQPTVGGDNNTWGGLLNTNLSLIDSALGGTLALSISGNITLNSTQAQNSGFKFTGTLSGNATITWPTFSGMAAIQNNTSGGYSIICGISGATVTVFNGETVSIWSDGTNFYRMTALGGGVGGTGEVTMRPYASQGSGTWLITDPYGIPVNTAGTTTQGLQEALNAAASLGTSFRLMGTGSITIPSGGITIPAMLHGNFQFDRTINLNFTSPGSGACVAIDSQENSNIYLGAGIIQGAGATGHCILIKPTNPTAAHNTIFSANTLYIEGASPASGGDGVYIDLTNGECRGNEIKMIDINGGTWAFQVNDPGSGFISFSGNIIYHQISHGQTSGISKVGLGVANQALLRGNTWFYGDVAPNNVSAVIHQTYESSSDIFITGEDGTYGTVLLIENSSCDGNRAFIKQTGPGAVTDNGTHTLIFIGGSIFASADFNLATLNAHKVTTWAGGSVSTLQPGGVITGSEQLTPAGVPANTTETVLQTYTIPGGLIGTIGQSVRVKAWGTFLGNSDTKTIRMYFGATTIYTTTPQTLTSGSSWIMECQIFNTGSSTQSIIGNCILGFSPGSITPQNATSGENTGGSIVVKVTGQNGTGTLNNIVCNGMIIEVLP